MRYRLRTLLILLAVVPPLVAFGWLKHAARRDEAAKRAAAIQAIDEERAQVMAEHFTLMQSIINDPALDKAAGPGWIVREKQEARVVALQTRYEELNKAKKSLIESR